MAEFPVSKVTRPWLLTPAVPGTQQPSRYGPYAYPVPPTLPPVPSPAPSPAGGTGGVPTILVYAVALLVLGAVAEGLYRVSAGAAYGFVFIVLVGYAASGGRLDNVTNFFRSIGVTQ